LLDVFRLRQPAPSLLNYNTIVISLHKKSLRSVVSKFNRPIGPMYVESGSRCSSVRIVSHYGLDDRAIGVRSPAEAVDFFL
jgi:hypothetical protein